MIKAQSVCILSLSMGAERRLHSSYFQWTLMCIELEDWPREGEAESKRATEYRGPTVGSEI